MPGLFFIPVLAVFVIVRIGLARIGIVTLPPSVFRFVGLPFRPALFVSAFVTVPTCIFIAITVVIGIVRIFVR